MNRYALCIRQSDAEDWVCLEIFKLERTARDAARYSVEKGIQTKIVTDFAVHHIDGDRFNNEVENLQIVPIGLNSRGA